MGIQYSVLEARGERWINLAGLNEINKEIKKLDFTSKPANAVVEAIAAALDDVIRDAAVLPLR